MTVVFYVALSSYDSRLLCHRCPTPPRAELAPAVRRSSDRNRCLDVH